MAPVVELTGYVVKDLIPVVKELPQHGFDLKFLHIDDTIWFFDPGILHRRVLEHLNPYKNWKNAGIIKFTENGIYVFSYSSSLGYDGDADKHRSTINQIRKDYPDREIGSMNFFSKIGVEQHFKPTA